MPVATKSCGHCGFANPVTSKDCGGCGEALAAVSADPLIGALLAGKYQIERRLGQGGMGTVYLARQQPLERECVLKVMRANVTDDPMAMRRFEKEAEMASKIYHPNAVAIHDFGRHDDGSAFICMELAHGRPLESLIVNEFPFTTERIVHILGQVCDVLQTGHDLKMVHRDLKPDNIMVGDLATAPDHVKLLDYGLAKIWEQRPGATQLTMAGAAMGTPEYMAPEQCSGQPVGSFTDIYALSCILYTMLAGVRPFHSESAAGYLHVHLTEAPVPPSKRGRASGVSPQLEKLALSGMRKRPNERPPSAREFKRLLAQAVAVTDTSAASPLRQLVTGAVALAQGAAVREAIVACVDVVPPADARNAEAIEAHLATLHAEVEQQRGSAERVGPTRLRAWFGADQLDAAVRTAQALLAASSRSTIALHVGSIEVVGGGLRCNETVDLVERMALHAPGGRIVLSDALASVAPNTARRALPALPRKGGETPVPLHELVVLAAAEEGQANAAPPIEDKLGRQQHREDAMRAAAQGDREGAMAAYRRACGLASAARTADLRFAEDVLALADLLLETGAVSEALRWLEQARPIVQNDKRLKARLSYEECRCLVERNEFQTANPLLAELLDVAKASRDVGLLADVLALAGEAAERAGQLDQASQRLAKALELVAKLPEQEAAQRAVRYLGRLGRVSLRANQLDKALAVFRQQKEAARSIGDHVETGRAMLNEAILAFKMGDTATGERLIVDVLEVARRSGDKLTVAKALFNGACVHASRKRVADARKGFEESLAIAQELAWQEGVAMNHQWLSKLAAR